MFKIEKFLLENGFELSKHYDESGVNVYNSWDGLEVVIFPNHKPIAWELHTQYPYSLTISNLREPDKKVLKSSAMENFSAQLDYWIDFSEILKKIENPWENFE